MSNAKSIWGRTEAERIAERKRLRHEIARREVQQKRLDEIAATVAEIDRQADQAADDHQRRCEPIQRELSRIESEQIEAIAERQPADVATEQLRVQLLAELSEHNETLEAAVEKCERLKKPLVAEFDKLRIEVAQGATLESNLATTAPLAARTAQFVAAQSENFARLRWMTAKENLQKQSAWLATAKANPSQYHVGSFAANVAMQDAEVEAAEKLHGEAKAALAAANRRLLDD